MNQLLCGREARRRAFSTLTRLCNQIAAHNERFLVVKFSMRTSTGVSVGQGPPSCATNRNRTAVCCLLNRRRNCRMHVFRKPSAILVVCGPVPTIATMSALDGTWVGDAGIQQSRRYWHTHPHGLFQTSKTFRHRMPQPGNVKLVLLYYFVGASPPHSFPFFSVKVWCFGQKLQIVVIHVVQYCFKRQCSTHFRRIFCLILIQASHVHDEPVDMFWGNSWALELVNSFS